MSGGHNAIPLNSDCTRNCTTCKKPFPLTEEFWYPAKLSYGGLRTACRQCTAAQRSRNNKQKRLQVLAHYSGGIPQCACCGETTLVFLAVDHINGGGNQERKTLGVGGGAQFYYWLSRQGYPEGYRVLCHNCNMAHSILGYCPHSQHYTPRLSELDLARILARVQAAERATA